MGYKTKESRMPADLLLCNCGRCGREMRSRECQADLSRYAFSPPLFVHTRIGGRPYCVVCYKKIKRLISKGFKG